MISRKCKNRRDFMKTALAGSLGAALPLAAPMGNTASQIVPKRTLGKTDMKISVLSFGGGSQFLNNPDGTWEPMLEKAIEDGINLFDTSPDYTNPSMSARNALVRFCRVSGPDLYQHQVRPQSPQSGIAGI